MAAPVIDTRGEFKLVPFSGDDEHWSQWVLKFEAWSELVGWGQQLDAAAASTLPIVNTTPETEVQTISRQLYAIFVVKLEGKALGIVQPVKGEGLEAWRQLKLEYEGKSGNRQAALLRGIVNPRAAWEADTRDGRSVVESLNRWEKTIGLYRTASGVDISDGILVVTVLEHWPESHQYILKQAPSNVRASCSAMRGWLREYAETLRRYDGTSGSSSHQTPSTGLVQWMSIRPVQCLNSRLAKTGKGNRRERARARMARAKARARKVTRARIRSRYRNMSNSKDTVGIATNGGHKPVDCRKRIAETKSKGGAAAACADDGDVAAVMEVDDVMMTTGDDETSTGRCFALTSMCAVVGSTGSLLLDCGSDEHLCTPKFADLIPTSRDHSRCSMTSLPPVDVQPDMGIW